MARHREDNPDGSCSPGGESILEGESHWSRRGGGGRPTGVCEETKGRVFEGAWVRVAGLGEMWTLPLSLMLSVGILGVLSAFLESEEMLTLSFPSSLFFAHYLLL